MPAFHYPELAPETIKRPVQALRRSIRRTPHSESQIVAIEFLPPSETHYLPILHRQPPQRTDQISGLVVLNDQRRRPVIRFRNRLKVRECRRLANATAPLVRQDPTRDAIQPRQLTAHGHINPPSPRHQKRLRRRIQRILPARPSKAVPKNRVIAVVIHPLESPAIGLHKPSKKAAGPSHHLYVRNPR